MGSTLSCSTEREREGERGRNRGREGGRKVLEREREGGEEE